MAYLALYRKYRSRTFDELAGQQFIVKTLQNSLKTGEISHAYLFCGPRGTGKTSMARLFAKALNCEEGLGHICNHCSNCEMINDGTHPDIVEIDAASNSSVEQIRTLIEKVKYSPIKGKYKVYIIDEVHMLSNSAFNALLKTLEEPPSDVIFILATTEPHKILPTIISRCQRYDFSKIADSDIKNRLLKIIDAEDISCDPDALNEIIKLADGCMRDALSILDQLVAFTNKQIHYDDLLKVFGLVSLGSQKEFLKSLFNGQMEDVIKKYHAYVEGGADVLRLNSNFIDDLKDILIFSSTKNKNLLERLPIDYVIELENSADLQYLNNLIELFMKANYELKTVSNIASAYEVTLIRAFAFENKLKAKGSISVKEPQNTEKIQENIDERVKTKEIIESNSTEKTKEKFDEVQTENNEVLPFMEENSKEDIQEDKPVEPVKVEQKKPAPKPEPKINTFEDFVAAQQKKDEGVFKESLKEKEAAKTIKVLEFDDEFLIKVIVKSSSALRKEFVPKLENLDDYLLDADYGKFANLLSKCAVFTACDEMILFQSQFKTVIAQLNSEHDNQKVCEFVSKLFGKQVHVYTISYQQASSLQQKYFNLKQINQLPNKATIGKLFK